MTVLRIKGYAHNVWGCQGNVKNEKVGGASRRYGTTKNLILESGHVYTIVKKTEWL